MRGPNQHHQLLIPPGHHIDGNGLCLWENGYCESCNSKLRDEFLNGEIFPR